MSKRQAAEELIKAQDGANTMAKAGRLTQIDVSRLGDAGRKWDSVKNS